MDHETLYFEPNDVTAYNTFEGPGFVVSIFVIEAVCEYLDQRAGCGMV